MIHTVSVSDEDCGARQEDEGEVLRFPTQETPELISFGL